MNIRQILILFSIYLAINGCSSEWQNKAKTQEQDSVMQGSNNNAVNDKSTQNIFIKDSSKYSKNFINDIIEYNSENLRFIDSLLIIGDDSAFMPIKLPANKKIVFSGCDNNNVCFILEVERINYSTIKYKIQKNKEKIIYYNESGVADIDHNFNYIDKDDEYEDEMKYSTITSDSCSFTIRIGTNLDKKFCAKLKRCFCKDETKDLYNSPTLYRKN